MKTCFLRNDAAAGGGGLLLVGAVSHRTFLHRRHHHHHRRRKRTRLLSLLPMRRDDGLIVPLPIMSLEEGHTPFCEMAMMSRIQTSLTHLATHEKV